MAIGIRVAPGDGEGFKLLLILAVMYGATSFLAYSISHMKFVKPLGVDAPLHRFSESRAIQHVRVLAQDGRQEGRPGLKKAAQYIKAELEALKGRAGPNVRIEIEESIVNGSFNMMFLRHSIGLGYRNHTNILMRISSATSQDDDPSVLINGHFDSPLGSPGAGDCGSCVASMLEVARVIVDSSWSPPRPIIFLFNGAEELFMLGAHGFMKSNKWRDSIGASINVEASGTGGPDLVCQSGPGAWPSQIYAQSAIFPMAHSAAQDVFPVIPGDTDYRMFSEDYGNIPSLDIIFLLGGYYYHTSYDTVDRLMPGSMQARGDNLLSIIKAFTNSSKLQNAREREASQANADDSSDERAVYFDFLSLFMVYYPRKVAIVLHSIPIAIFLIMPFFRILDGGLHSTFLTFCDMVKGMLFHAAAVLLAIALPIIFSIARLLFSSYAMSWFARPYLAFMMFVPCSLIGLLMPRMIWNNFPLSQDVSGSKKSKEAFSDEARFWGAFGFYAIFTLAYLVAGLSGGFLTFLVSAFMLLAWITFGWSVKSDDRQSVRSMFFYIVPLVPCIIYSVYFGGFLVQFLIEKMGMMGAGPPPLGYFVADLVVAAAIGIVTGWCFGPLLPVCSSRLARSSILQFLLHASVLAMALSSQFFPYSNSAPKRVVLQHTFVTSDQNMLVDSSYEFSVVDSNSLPFLFKHAPEVAKELELDSGLSFETASVSHKENWTVLFPVNFMISRSLKFPAKTGGILKQYRRFPHLSSYRSDTILREGFRRVYLELSLGSRRLGKVEMDLQNNRVSSLVGKRTGRLWSLDYFIIEAALDLQQVWVAVLNITGPLSRWSFADNVIPAPETFEGGPPSYICRLSGTADENWTFWLEARIPGNLRVEVAVLDQVLTDDTKKLKDLFPNWVDVLAYSSFMSSNIF